ncbi:hypothetical protein [Brachybacterium huguangmaarense]
MTSGSVEQTQAGSRHGRGGLALRIVAGVVSAVVAVPLAYLVAAMVVAALRDS